MKKLRPMEVKFPKATKLINGRESSSPRPSDAEAHVLSPAQKSLVVKRILALSS